MKRGVREFWNFWRLRNESGRQFWVFEPTGSFDPENSQHLKDLSQAFLFDASLNPNSGDKVYRSQQVSEKFQPDNLSGDPVRHSAHRGWQFYQSLQAEDGHWPGDYGGPLFLAPGLIIASYITQTPFSTPQKVLFKRYMLNHQNPDGGWGLHIEGESTMFGTVMQYVALRLLGMGAQDPELKKARNWIIQHGGASGIPSWGKFYLALLGVYSWEGCHSLFPEAWSLPGSLPIHPSRYWCHARMVYLPMAYCYGHRISGQATDLIEELKKEIYTGDYEKIKWSGMKNRVAETDLYVKTSPWLKRFLRLVNTYERFHVKSWRKKALNFVLEYIQAEDQQTDYVDIGPINQILNSVCVWHAYGKDSEAFKKHVERWKDYLWIAEDGLKMSGYNGSQLWDTAFATQALLENGLEEQFPETLQKAYRYLDQTQVKEDVPDGARFFRHRSKGGWPFSTVDHGWPISDCTAEGLSSVLKAHQIPGFRSGLKRHIEDHRLFDAVDLILSFQNNDGGWATYENTRSRPWLEFLNPSEVFGKIMIDYSWVECTAACVRALCEFQEQYPTYKTAEIEHSLLKGIGFIRGVQNQDGSWTGSWGVCFTYGTWFGVEALATAKDTVCSKEKYFLEQDIRMGCEFLISKQNPDGGWGESYLSCVKEEYVPHQKSQVVQTSWALLALMAGNHPEKDAIERGIHWLRNMQESNGDWPQEGISGVFNQNCMITYTAYRNVFPLWALERHSRLYGKKQEHLEKLAIEEK